MEWISNIVSILFEWIQNLGYFGIMLGLMIEVIPSEIVLAYGGYLVYGGHINYVGAVFFGVVGELSLRYLFTGLGVMAVVLF